MRARASGRAHGVFERDPFQHGVDVVLVLRVEERARERVEQVRRHERRARARRVGVRVEAEALRPTAARECCGRCRGGETQDGISFLARTSPSGPGRNRRDE
jgi:hypothetical protein